MTDRWH